MSIRNLFRLEQRLGPTGDAMKQQLLWMLLLRVILYTLLLGISFLLQDDRFEVITLPPNLLVIFILFIYLFTIGSAFLLISAEGDHRRFGFIQSLADTVFAALLVYLSGSSHSIFTSTFFFPIIAAGLLLPVKGGLIAAAASTLLYGIILGVEYTHFLPSYLEFHQLEGPNSILVSINHFAVRGLTFFLAAMVSSIFGIRLKTAIDELSSTQQDFDRLSRLYKKIFDNISTGIITVNGVGTITSANNATSMITGLSQRELIGKKLLTLFPLIDLSDPSPRMACDFERPDSERIRIGYAQATLKGTDHNPYFRINVHPEEDITIITLKDISEIERLEAQMRQAEKLAALGMMSASIAHDFRNPLTAISGSAQILAQEFSTSNPAEAQNYDLTRIILRESDRLIKTIADFLKFARPDRTDKDLFHLKPLLDEVIQVCRANTAWPASCEFIVEIESNYSVWADETQLFTVISHLIHNAFAFCPEGMERIRVSASNQTGPTKEIMASIAVEDNGPGVDQTHQKQIFEPFFTSRSDGTGLGLAIVKQTVEAHNGFVVMGDAELGGACFTVYLPLQT